MLFHEAGIIASSSLHMPHFSRLLSNASPHHEAVPDLHGQNQPLLLYVSTARCLCLVSLVQITGILILALTTITKLL